MPASEPDFAVGRSTPVDLDVRWIHGTRSGRIVDEDLLQVHAVDEHTYILRQSKNVTFEAPFCYLLIGRTAALLLDTGAVGPVSRNPIRATVDDLLDRWRERYPGPPHRLIVAHSHSHGDHVAGDHQFADRSDTTVVGRDLASVQRFFRLDDWPDGVAELDLGGGRVLETLPIPGHHETHIAVYDPWTGFLLSGDTLYPGRIYAPRFADLMHSADRLARFAADRVVTQVLGAHIEMTTKPGVDYPMGTRYQPDEPPLPLPPSVIEEFRVRTVDIAGKIGRHRFDDMIVYNSPGRITMLREQFRGVAHRLGERLSQRR